jgi:hypothetical protein
MTSRFTGLRYDQCAAQQHSQQQQAPIEYMMDIDKFVHPKRPQTGPDARPLGQLDIVDVESSLMGLDRVKTRCEGGRYPLCNQNGCLINRDSRIPQNDTPYILERNVPTAQIPPPFLPKRQKVASGYYRNE